MFYNVAVHYEGSWNFKIDANSEDEACDMALKMFDEIDADDLISNLADVSVDDCWEGAVI